MEIGNLIDSATATVIGSRAVAHYKAVGRTRALADFNEKVGPFGVRDLSVVCLAPDRAVVANGAFPSHVGRSAMCALSEHARSGGTRSARQESAQKRGAVGCPQWGAG